MVIFKGSYLSHTIILGIHVGFEECTPPNAGFLSPISFVPQLVASISYTLLDTNSSHLKIGFFTQKGQDRLPTIYFQVLWLWLC